MKTVVVVYACVTGVVCLGSSEVVAEVESAYVPCSVYVAFVHELTAVVGVNVRASYHCVNCVEPCDGDSSSTDVGVEPDRHVLDTIWIPLANGCHLFE